jgi:hypothetical protein
MNADRTARLALVGLNLFLGVNAVFGAVAVVPALPPEWLTGTPFPDYSLPALALGAVGAGAVLAAGGLLLREAWGLRLSLAVGAGVAIYEVVETLVVGLDVWLRALGLTAAPGKGLPGTSLDGVPAPLGVPLPLWQQPAYFALGLVMAALALRLTTPRARRGLRPRLAADRSRSRGPVVTAVRTRSAAPADLVLRPIPALLVFAGLWLVFLLVLHPWMMRWGATPEERAMALPGDAAPPAAYFTRAISIEAPPAAVWPWLVQIGQDRAGFYSNDWLENLFGGDIHNADVIRAEWQQRALGDRAPMAGDALQRLGGEYTLLTVRTLEPERVIADVPGRFVLLPRGEGGTRLLLRESLTIPERSGLAWLVWDPMHFVMEQRMLQGIRERAEGRPLVPPVAQAAARAGWALAGLGLLGVFVSRPRWWPWLLLPAVPVASSLALTGDPHSALAGFLAVGITAAGALSFGRRWWPPYLLLASAVALVLLLAPDAYAAFGLLFLFLFLFLGLLLGVLRAPWAVAAAGGRRALPRRRPSASAPAAPAAHR